MRMWKNMVQPDRPQMTLEYGSCTLHAGYLICNTYCFSMAPKVMWTCPYVTFIHTLHVLSIIINHSTYYHHWYSNQKATWTL